MRGRRKIASGLGLGLALFVAGPIAAVQQQMPLPPSSATGRTVTPAYEGWYENTDGTYSLSFGYYNRNTGEIVEIPLGSDNMIEPAGLAQNQPTRFEEGRHWGTFAVRIPGDFADQEVTWTLKMRGQVFMVPGYLRPEWKIDALYEGAHDNTPPVLRFEQGGQEITGPGASGFVFGPLRATVGEPVEITLYANDDGKGRSLGGFGARGRGPRAIATLTWFKHQGPGDVTFSEASQRVSEAWGEVVNSVTFETPGEYVIRIRATDSSGVEGAGHSQCCWSNGFVAVSVNP